MNKKLEKIKKIVEKELSCSAHGMDHIMRVYNLSKRLGKGQKIDWEVLGTAAILHDIAGVKEMNDPSGKTDHALVGAKMAEPILKKLGYSENKIKHIQNCIISHRFKTDNKPKTLEAKILFDADKLDAIGAIGIARAFAWVGKNNAKIYKKITKPILKKYIKENLNGKINGRIQDKTKHCPQIELETKYRNFHKNLQTKAAKNFYKDRYNYYRNFLKRLEKEVNGQL